MNNLQHVVKDNTRYAMHVAIELCEQGDFDSTREAFAWLMQERNELDGGTCELIASTQVDKRAKTGYKLASIHCSECGEQHGGAIRYREDGTHVIYREEQDVYCRHCGSKITNVVGESTRKAAE